MVISRRRRTPRVCFASLFVVVAVVHATAGPRLRAPRETGAPAARGPSSADEHTDYLFAPAGTDGARVANTTHAFVANISARGLAVTPTDADASWKLELTTTGLGRASAIAPVKTKLALVDRMRVELDHGGVREWFTNDERGLEQSWSVASRPEGDERAELALQFSVGGTLSLHIADDGLSGKFVDPRGRAVLRYHSLAAWDAQHRALNVRLAPGPNGPRILVVDADAAYPITIDPVLSGPVWTDEGEQPNETFGAALSTAGDVNGDGYSDFLVGAPAYDGGQTDEGRVALYLGTASGPDYDPAWNIEGNQANAACGTSVSSAADVNADGYDDVLVGVPGFDGGVAFEGKVELYLGSASGLAATPAWTAEGNQANARFGISVSMAGDVNADGFGDVVIGAKSFDNGETDEGRAFLYLGTASGLAAGPAWTAESQQVGAEFGGSVAAAGDVNGDGFADVIVGAPLFDVSGATDNGAAFVFHGTATGLASTPAQELNAGAVFNGRFGSAVARAGDVNGDGFGDVLVGSYAWGFGNGEEGYAWLYLGSSGGVAATPAWQIQGNQFGAHLGVSLATAGDVNGDGFADVVVGADGYRNPGGVQVGRAQVFLGSPSGLSTTAAWSALGIQAGSQFGAAVATAGDVNSDGFSDVLVSDPRLDYKGVDTGRVSLYFGGPATLPSTSPTWSVQPASGVQDAMGYSVASAGDVDGDGYTDVLVSSPLRDNGPIQDAGAVDLFRGGPNGLASQPAWTATGQYTNARFGTSVGTAGDVNGDGFDDVVISDFSAGGNGYLFLGSSAGLSSTPNQQFGTSGLGSDTQIAAAGDVNADGYGDVLFASVIYQATHYQSAVHLHLGSAAGLSPIASWTAVGSQPGSYLGFPARAAGDVDGDGYGDVVVADVTHESVGNISVGRVFVYRGNATGLTSTAAYAFEPPWVENDGWFGYSVGGADFNGDGYSDLLVGYPGYGGGVFAAGGAYAQVLLYFGSPSGPSPMPAWTLEGWHVVNGFQGLVGSDWISAGDVNGDGFADIMGTRGPLPSAGLPARLALHLGSSSGPSLVEGWFAPLPSLGYWYGGVRIGAGDFDGNGLSELVNGKQSNVAGASVYSFSDHGSRLRPGQARTATSARIGLLGSSDPANTFAVHADASNGAGTNGSAAGRARTRVEWEVKSQPQPLNGTNLQRAPSFQDTGAPGGAPLALSGTATGLVPQGRYHWRVRVATNDPCFPHSRWVSIDGNALSETKLRMVCNPAVLTPDCNGNGIGDACDVSTGDANDCDHDGTPDSCELVGNDCDGNLVPDNCEAALHDCNGNGNLDVCDIAAGTPDADNNGILDTCEIHAFCFGDGTLVDHTTPCPCGNNGLPGNGCGHSFDPNGANLTATGHASTNDVVLHSGFEPASSFTLFLQHETTGDAVFHDGVLCAGGTLIRLRGRAAVAGEAFFPNSSFAQDSTTTLSQRGSVTVGSGVRRYYSAWYRNAATTFCPPKTANVTNGIRIDW